MAGEIVHWTRMRRPRPVPKSVPPTITPRVRRGHGFRYIGAAFSVSTANFVSAFTVPAVEPSASASANFRSDFQVIGGDLANGRYRR